MPSARLTVKAMQKILNEDSKSMSDYWNLTEASPLYNKDILVWTIMKRGGSLEVLEYDPDDFYTDCAFWWTKWNRTFNKWIAALGIEYNPLENYDRMEDWTDSEETDGGTSTTRSSTENVNGTNGNTRTLDTSEDIDRDTTLAHHGSDTVTTTGTTDIDSTTTNEKSAFNSDSYSSNDRTIVDSTQEDFQSQTTSYNTSETGTDDTTRTNTGTITDAGTNTSATTTSETITGSTDGTKEGTHTGRMHGNIGVTTSQQMLEAELNLQYWNLYNHMADLFIQECTTRVY